MARLDSLGADEAPESNGGKKAVERYVVEMCEGEDSSRVSGQLRRRPEYLHYRSGQQSLGQRMSPGNEIRLQEIPRENLHPAREVCRLRRD